MKNKKVIVIGAGIIGLCSAYYLNKKGFKVTVFDNTDGTDNCSYGNAGFFSPSHIIPLASPGIISQGLRWMMRSDSPFYIKPKLNGDLISWGLKFWKASNTSKVNESTPVLHQLLMRSRKLIENIIDEEGMDVELNNKGLLMFCKSQKALDEEIEIAELANKYGQKAEVLSSSEAGLLNPGLELDVKGAVLFKEDASISPYILMEQLIKLLIKKGVTIQFDNHMDKIVAGTDNKIAKIIANGEEHMADEYVIATGSWSRGLMKQVGIKLPLQGGKGYSFMLPTPKVMPQIANILTEARVAVTPMKDGLRFAGTMEVNGLDLSINPKRVQGIVNSITEYFPQFENNDFKDIEPWAGLRPCSPDGLPYIGRTHSYNNLLVATGHAMLGVSLGPVTGKLISQLVANEQPEIDISLLSVERYN